MHRQPQRCFGTENEPLANTHLFSPEQHNWSIWNILGSQVGDCLCCLFLWQLRALENSQHTQIAALMAETGMDEQGLAPTMVQHGPYLQITSLAEKSPAANNGKLKPGAHLLNVLNLK
ncbi:PDZ domain-containing protein 9 [Prinia subflava]|uniref:PDZ domain-containing protein 9 n=1 Tax=Prinia subflava TaxID=208062 RepID=UPI002FE176DC